MLLNWIKNLFKANPRTISDLYREAFASGKLEIYLSAEDWSLLLREFFEDRRFYSPHTESIECLEKHLPGRGVIRFYRKRK